MTSEEYHPSNRVLLLGITGCVIVASLLISVFSSASSPMPFVPLSDGENVGSFSFIVYGDIQENYRNGHQALVDLMLKEDAAFVVNTGDISKDRGKHYETDFYPVVQGLAERIPYFPSVGNHDVDWGSRVSRNRFLNFFRKTFDYLAKKQINTHLLDPSSQKLWYSFIYGKILFIVLDSNLFIDEGRY